MKRLLLKIVFFGLTLGLMPQGTFAMQNHQDAPRIIAKATGAALLASLFVKYVPLLSLIGHILITGNMHQKFPILTTQYAQNLEIVGTPLAISRFVHVSQSKKYGEIIPISEELQRHSDNNITILQLLSSQQDGPTCLKYAFSNLAIIDQLYRNGKAITSKNIAQEIERPLKIIGFPGKTEWKKDSLPYNTYWQDDVVHYAKTFFPDNNMHLVDVRVGRETARIMDFFYPLIHPFYPYAHSYVNQEIKEMLGLVINDLNTHGSSHILFCCGQHAMGISIMMTGKNSYSIAYMDSNNLPIAPLHDAACSTYCYLPLKTLVTQLKDTVEGKLITNK